MAMIAYQCSRCKLLQDADDYVWCGADIDPRPKHREKEMQSGVAVILRRLKNQRYGMKICLGVT